MSGYVPVVLPEGSVVPAGVLLNPSGRTGRGGLQRSDGRLFERYGPNLTADVAVTVTLRDGTGLLLFIRRSDNNKLALPGGRVETGETVHETAERELQEEAGLTCPVDPRPIFCGPVNDPRDTDHAWFSTTLFTVTVTPEKMVEAKSGSDATETVWVPVNEALNHSDLYEPHRKLVEAFLHTRNSNDGP